MIRAKNYETVLKFVRVMSGILVDSFFRTRCRRDKWHGAGMRINEVNEVVYFRTLCAEFTIQ